jgi:NAD(P)-dependent dehydrogenase (short-subunit alcohol dehydrogenase family)
MEAVQSVRDIRLDGKVAIVTGAARGLGRAMAEGLARAGATVVLADLDARALAQPTTSLEREANPRDVRGIACDITSKADCELLVAQTVAASGALHVLVNNAGKGPAHLERSPHTRSLKFWESDPEIWREIIDTNVNGTFLIARAAAPHMITAGWGRIINVTTSLATMQRRANSPYGVSKAAIEAETLIWAKDLDGTGVTVNSLIPGGAADTDFVHMAARKELAARGQQLLPPNVMVAPVIWLASAYSDGITGARFVGKLWDESLPPREAAAKAREAPVLRTPPLNAR